MVGGWHLYYCYHRGRWRRAGSINIGVIDDVCSVLQRPTRIYMYGKKGRDELVVFIIARPSLSDHPDHIGLKR